MAADDITLTAGQSLALRQLIEALKRDDSVFNLLPADVRNALCDILLPPYASSEQQIRALTEAHSKACDLAEKFANRIRDLEARLAVRRKLPPLP